jgi:peptidoglycan/LPS O-acetylase OafA/YrhL
MTRNNNFDLIRLLAALQVVLGHLHGYQGLTLIPQSVRDILKYFPGVVVFFVISGFLIFASFDRNRDLVQYYKNRLLRIFPALWVAFIISSILVYTAGYSAGSAFETIKWILAQLTLFQFYIPHSIWEYAKHNPNPSLWTIAVEFSFYVFVPLLFWFARKRMNMTAMILIFIIGSCICNYYVMGIDAKDDKLPLIWKENLLPYLYYFLLGSLAYLHFEKIKKFIVGKGIYWLGAYLVYVGITGVYLDLYDLHYYMNIFGMISAVILAPTVISLAYTFPDVSKKILRGNDISYGVYLYHMIVILAFNRLGYYGNNKMFIPEVLITIGIALLSWIIIEKPALKLKKLSIRRMKFSRA